MFIIENICSHKYVLPNSDNNRQAVFDTSVCARAETSVES